MAADNIILFIISVEFMNKSISNETVNSLSVLQKNEITEYQIYTRLARRITNQGNKEVLLSIASDELTHYKFWKEYTGRDVKPNWFKVYFYYCLALILGLTFSIKLMERGEVEAQDIYQDISREIPAAGKIVDDEDRHEEELIALLEEERLQYVGSIVLGLNDALVELTGTLAGLSFALKNTRLIALAGMITGIAASFSMAASEYLSTKSESSHSHALKSSLYTGGAYILTVFFLILPYLLISNYLFSLSLTIVAAIMIIFIFNFYISVAKDLDFKKRFLEMTSISLGVALLSFVIGIVVRVTLGVDI